MKPSEEQALARFEADWKRKLLDRQRESEPTGLQQYRERVADEKATMAAAMKILNPAAAAEPEPVAVAVAVAVEEPIEEIDPTRVKLVGDFSALCEEYHAGRYGNSSSLSNIWRRRKRAKVGLVPEVAISELTFEFCVTSYGPDGDELETVTGYLDNFKIPEDEPVTIKRGVIGEIHVMEKVTGIFGGFFHFDESDKLDLVAARAASDEEVGKIFAPPVVEAPAPPAPPTFQRITRTAGDSASFLGFSLGSAVEEVVIPKLTVWHAFHLPTASVIGSVESGIQWECDSDIVPIEIHDASGNRVLQAVLRAHGRHGVLSAQFDAVRLEAGDHLLLMKGGYGRRAKGCVKPMNSGLVPHGYRGSMLLDNLMKLPPTEDPMTGHPIQVTLPHLRFR